MAIANILPATPFRIRMFGEMAVEINGVPLPPMRTKKERWLLAILALKGEAGVDREWLAAALWPDGVQPRSNLRRSLVVVREALGVEARRLVAVGNRLRLDLGGTEFDVSEFDRMIKRGDVASLSAALAIYRGRLVEGCDADWVELERTRREEALLSSVEAICDLEESRTVLPLLRRAVQIDPTRESTVRRLMNALAVSGDLAGALEVFRDHRARLGKEFGWAPSGELQALFDRLSVESRAARRARSVVLPKLPHFASAFLGRDPELTYLARAVRQSRFVTLTGLPAVGKTRLAVETGHRIATDFPDGVFFVALGGCKVCEEVASLIASTMGLQFSGQADATESLLRIFSHRRFLLILDGVDELAFMCGDLFTSLAQAGPTARLLATSREALGIPGEKLCALLPLPVPQLDSLDLMLDSPSVRLFEDRARLVLPSFELTAKNAALVTGICRRLDGVPLAIEIAAAFVNTMSLASIERVLEQRLNWDDSYLTPSASHHRTLKAAFDWSYDRLEGESRHLLQAVATFTDGWTAEAAQSVACASEASVLSGLRQLVDKSLVVFDPHTSRYHLLGITRDYVGLKTGVEDKEKFRERMARYFEARFFALDADGDRLYASRGEDVMLPERENLRAAVAWLQENEPDRALELEFRLYAWQIWTCPEEREWISRLEAGFALPEHLQPTILVTVAFWAHWLQHPAAHSLMERALETARHLDQPRWESAALNGLAVISAGARNDPIQAATYERLGREAAERACLPFLVELHTSAEQSYISLASPEVAKQNLYSQLARGRATNNWRSLYAAIKGLGSILTSEGDFQAAEPLVLEAVSLGRVHCAHELSFILEQLGTVHWELGKFSEAREALEEAVDVGRSRGTRDREASAHAILAEVAARSGDFEEAEERLTTAKTLFMDVGALPGAAGCLLRHAGIARMRLAMDECVSRLAEFDAFVVAHGLRPSRMENKTLAELRAWTQLSIGDSLLTG